MQAAIVAKLRIETTQDPSGHCAYGFRADGQDAGVACKILTGVVQRIDVQVSKCPDVQTAAGVGLGPRASAVKQVYEPRAMLDQQDDKHRQFDFFIKGADAKGGVEIGFDGPRVAGLVGGDYPAVSYDEGCL